MYWKSIFYISITRVCYLLTPRFDSTRSQILIVQISRLFLQLAIMTANNSNIHDGLCGDCVDFCFYFALNLEF